MDPDEFFLHTLDGGGNTPLDQLSVKTSAKLLEVCILLKSGFGWLILGGWFGRLVWAAGRARGERPPCGAVGSCSRSETR
jgi:hypothetical protein